MPNLNLSPDELLSTTRSVRKRLDLSRQVEPALIRECLELAMQAPTGANSQQWQFVVVTDTQQRQALGAIYQKGWKLYLERMATGNPLLADRKFTREQAATLKKVRDSSEYLAEHMHEVPVQVVPCIRGRVEGLASVEQAGIWGSILPAVWSFMLAARARGLGSCWTTIHLYYEQAAAELLGIPYERMTQVALIPVAILWAPSLSQLHAYRWNRWYIGIGGEPWQKDSPSASSASAATTFTCSSASRMASRHLKGK